MKKGICFLLVFAMLSGVMVFCADTALTFNIKVAKASIMVGSNYDITYSITATASGGTEPYQYKFELLQNNSVSKTVGYGKENNISGKISGTGDCSVRVSVKDNKGAVVTKEQSLTKEEEEETSENSDNTNGEIFVKTREFKEGMFSDVGYSEWYYPSIKNCYEMGFMNGRSENLFAPNDLITVAEAIALASRIHNIYNGKKGLFTQGATWYQVYVDYAMENNIITNTQFDEYARPIKRCEFASLIAHTLPVEWYHPINNVTKIPDVKETEDYYKDVLLLYNAGIIMGNDGSGTFNPDNDIKRSETAAIITRVALKKNRVQKKIDS